MTAPCIDSDRLWASIEDLSRFGAVHWPDTGLTGVDRMALTQADAEGRAQVRKWFENAGLQIRGDRIGNLWARRAGTSPGLAPVVCGSHLDSVPTGGAFDGALGVLAGLEVVRTLDDAGVQTRRSFEVCVFTDEEGARFGTDMLGSAVACGRLPLDEALGLKDRDGVTVAQALAQFDLAGLHPVPVPVPHCFLEVHVEQGPILHRAGEALGIVTGVQGISWTELIVTGRSAHAGTTPMALRVDANLAVARLQVALHEAVATGAFGTDQRVTIGRISPVPNRINVIAGQCICSVDLRNPDESGLAAAEQALDALIATLCDELGVTIEARRTARTLPIAFDASVQAVFAGIARRHGWSHRHMVSGAGHDTQEFAAVCPAGMVFVPGEHDGISHNPLEYSTPLACGRGAQALLEAVVTLSQ
jgi:beta-ureidopropionase / N-carbamoyl-L-amino-acid hydrolase